MTSFATQTILTPVLSPLVSKDKGTMGNRIDCGVNQLKNGIVSTAQTALVLGAGGGAAYGIYNSPKAQKITSDVLTKTKAMMSKNKYTGKVAEWVAKGLKGMSTRGKAAAIIAAVTLPILSFIGSKQIYKAGQIDQKYTDKAGLQQYIG